MIHLNKLTLMAITLLSLAAALPVNDVIAQERLVFKVSAENTKYIQQHTIDVGDVPGHQVRIFEIHRTYPSNAPVISGTKIIESWTRGIPQQASMRFRLKLNTGFHNRPQTRIGRLYESATA